MTRLLDDSLSSGDFQAWSRVVNLPKIQSSTLPSAVNMMKVTGVNQSGRSTYISKYLNGFYAINGRAYVNFASFPTLGNVASFLYFYGGNLADGLFRVHNNGGMLYWAFASSATGYSNIDSAVTPALNTWYCCEISLSKSSTAPFGVTATLKVNNVAVLSYSFNDADATNYRAFWAGLWDNADNLTVYMTHFAVDDSAIGLLPSGNSINALPITVVDGSVSETHGFIGTDWDKWDAGLYSKKHNAYGDLIGWAFTCVEDVDSVGWTSSVAFGLFNQLSSGSVVALNISLGTAYNLPINQQVYVLNIDVSYGDGGKTRYITITTRAM